MLNIGAPSRFACLKDDDDSSSMHNKPKKLEKKEETPAVAKKSNVKPEKPLKLKKSTNDKPNVGVKTTSKRKKNSSAVQWEEWKVKDSEIVNGTYEKDLQNAIMLSKLDYEHNKELSKKNEKAPNATESKKKKNKVMSINEFLKPTLDSNNPENAVKVDNNVKHKDFFVGVKNLTKNELNKEQVLENRKKREANIDKIVSLAQCQEKLEEERAKRLSIAMELEKAKQEISRLKQKNKTLCSILSQGEVLVKDKADVLVELTEEVTRLHVLLEQERSKVAGLTSDVHNNNKHKEHKDKVKK